MPKIRYTDKIRAQAMALLIQGNSLSQVSEDLGISRTTLHNWRVKSREIVPATAVASEKEQRESRIAELIGAYLESSLEALAVQAKLFGDEDWLREQGAKPVGVLHGILLDKSVRILDAIERSHRRSELADNGSNVIDIEAEREQTA